GADEPFQGDLLSTCREFCDLTRDYWVDWVRSLSISYDWQDAIIRAAITLKLSNFEESGGIVAAHTTSIPEAPGSSLTWDYRYCWLRDAYFVVKALNRIGATETMEDFISFTLGIAANPDEVLRPVYSVVPIDPLEERVAPKLKGYRGDGPVRVGNAAVGQPQHDVYGSLILRPWPCFTSPRCPAPVMNRCSPSWKRSAPRPRNPRSNPARASGNTAAGAASIPIPRPCAGRDATGSPRSRRGSASRTAPLIGPRLPIRSARPCSSVPGTRSAKRSPPHSAPTSSTRACCCCRISA